MVRKVYLDRRIGSIFNDDIERIGLLLDRGEHLRKKCGSWIGAARGG